MPTVSLGNTAPTIFVKDDEKSGAGRKVDAGIGPAVTQMGVPPGTPVGEALTTVRELWWRHHANEPPAWVECSDELLEAVLAQEFDCPVGRVKGWDNKPKPKKRQEGESK